MRFRVSPAAEDLAGFESWFDRWIDLEGNRSVEGESHYNIIHSSKLEKGLVEVDFGSAPTDAVIELLDLLSANGVKTVRVSSAQIETYLPQDFKKTP